MTEDKKIQEVLNRLISEEWIASVMYKQFVLAAKSTDERHQLKDLLLAISEDEMDDHYDKLVKFAVHNDFDVPCQIRDYERYASKETTKQFKGWKKNQGAKYYLKQALSAEIEAIGSYEWAMSMELPYELLQILLPNMYDEQDHLRKIQTAINILETGANYVYCA